MTFNPSYAELLGLELQRDRITVHYHSLLLEGSLVQDREEKDIPSCKPAAE